MISDIFNRIELMIQQTKTQIESCTDENLEDRLYAKLRRLDRIEYQLKGYVESINEINNSLNEEEKW